MLQMKKHKCQDHYIELYILIKLLQII